MKSSPGVHEQGRSRIMNIVLLMVILVRL